MSIIIVREHTISCGHRVAGHESKCSNFHGHNYTIHIKMRAEHDQLDNLNRVLDFGVMKSLFVQWLEDEWDHKFLMWENDPLRSVVDEQIPLSGRRGTIPIPGLPGFVFVPFNPTAEAMANYLLRDVFPTLLHIPDRSVQVVAVQIDETPKCSAMATLL
jgi:6-pyruvoyltetrahydropterin/6-carboxytetrahydropterin synthase